PEPSERNDYSPAGAIIDLLNYPVAVEPYPGQYDPWICRAFWAIRKPTLGQRFKIYFRWVLVRIRTVIQNADLITVAEARKLALRVTATAACGLHAHRSSQNLFVLGRDVKCDVPAFLLAPDEDVAAPGINHFARGFSANADQPFSAQINHAHPVNHYL